MSKRQTLHLKPKQPGYDGIAEALGEPMAQATRSLIRASGRRE